MSRPTMCIGYASNPMKYVFFYEGQDVAYIPIAEARGFTPPFGKTVGEWLPFAADQKQGWPGCASVRGVASSVLF